jgi:hypothetical protein
LPVPLRLTVCGLPTALSVNLSVPVVAPVAVGANFTLTLHLEPAEMLDPQELLEIAKLALTAMLENVSDTFWLLVTVTDWDELVLPTDTVPKLRELAESVTGVLPVPERLTVCGLVNEASVNVSVPEIEPVVVGENVTPTVHLAPAAMLVPQVLLATAKLALAAMLLNVSATFSLLVRVTLLAELVLPTATVPRLKLVAESVTGVLPVPDRLTVCGLLDAASVKVSVPVDAPISVGEKVTPTVQVPLAATLEPQVLLEIPKPAVVAMLEKLTATFS